MPLGWLSEGSALSEWAVYSAGLLCLVGSLALAALVARHSATGPPPVERAEAAVDFPAHSAHSTQIMSRVLRIRGRILGTRPLTTSISPNEDDPGNWR